MSKDKIYGTLKRPYLHVYILYRLTKKTYHWQFKKEQSQQEKLVNLNVFKTWINPLSSSVQFSHFKKSLKTLETCNNKWKLPFPYPEGLSVIYEFRVSMECTNGDN